MRPNSTQSKPVGVASQPFARDLAKDHITELTLNCMVSAVQSQNSFVSHLRADRSWQVAPPAPGLVDRRVEITGPTDKKMTINALADFEDANTPLCDNLVTGQLNLVNDALDRTIDFTSDDGKGYRLAAAPGS